MNHADSQLHDPPCAGEIRRVFALVVVFGTGSACADDHGDTAADAGTASPGTSHAATSSSSATTTASTPQDPGTGSANTAADATSADSGPPPTTNDSGPSPVDCEPEPVPDICQAAHDHWVVCIYGQPTTDESYLFDCSCRVQLGASEGGPACGEAIEAWYACVAQAPCMDIVLDEHCPDELSAIQAECPRFSPA